VQKLRAQERNIDMRRQNVRITAGLMAIARVVGEKTRKGKGHASHACTRLCGKNGNNHTCWGRKKKNTTQQGDGEAYRPYLSRLEREKNRTAGRKETCENKKNSTSLPTVASGFAIRPNTLKKRKQ
jgi:hypothetical protein